MEAICEVCGETFIKYPSDNKFTCSYACSSKYRSLRRSTHGGSYTRLYTIWCDMKARCNPANAKTEPYYAGRGIRVCRQWVESYAAFERWAMNAGYRDGLTLDRRDGTKGYGPDNCRWATRQQQASNVRSRRQGNKTSRFKGVGVVPCGRWRATLVVGGKNHHLGMFDTEEEAAEAYNIAASEAFGEFAGLNQVQGGVLS